MVAVLSLRPSFLAAFLTLASLVTPALGRADWDLRFSPFLYNPADRAALYLRGPLNARSALAFSQALDEFGEVQTVVLSSPGGEIYSGLIIAREIERRGLSTAIPRHALCLSACAFLYLAGENRKAAGRLGVHQISSNERDFFAGQFALSDIMALFDDLDVPNDVFMLMLRTPASDMHVFTPEEMGQFGLVGSRIPTEAVPPSQGGGDLWADEPALDPEAQVNLALTFFEGEWVRQAHAEAVRWFGLAADRGFAPARVAQGLYSAMSNRVLADPQQAAELFMSALAQAEPIARSALVPEPGSPPIRTTGRTTDGDFGQGTITALDVHAREAKEF